ncbi:alpha/beta hydrolase family protein [uncultured Prevotella sp.]|uniref:alpha/beta hydrolase family protein n=1 Tax=uncultured Prevotella sp. TaxID=159272 RepID=UPI0027E39E20|nr:alpha/beta hydrolase family protein [uncultured Prevotella sp.]
MKQILIAFTILVNANLVFSQTTFDPQQHRVVTTDRPDGRFVSTYGVVHNMLKNTTPECAFNPDFSREQFASWRERVRTAMETIMCHPKAQNMPKPKRVSVEQKDGYRLETWEAYPLEGCVTGFKVMVPDGKKGAIPDVLCIPGSGMAKEHLTGEIEVKNPHAAMALNIVRHGYIAVAVDNACSGEASDLERLAGVGYDYDIPSRILLELGWSWLGYTSYLNKQVLEWMKEQPSIRRDRIVVSGFSLGTEPLMVLGVMDKSIYAFVYNDFLCQTQERAVVMTAPDKRGRRPFPNSIRHLIPRFWNYFNFPDIVASLAPRPIIFTEGGLDRDLNLVRRAYEISGNPDGVEIHHYPKYANPENRKDVKSLPEGLDRTEYFDAVNVDGPNHYFKDELVLSWLDEII